MSELQTSTPTQNRRELSLPTSASTLFSAWTIRVETTNEGFDALEADWERLTSESACSVFQQFAWLRSWWNYFGTRETTRLHIVVISYEGTVVGIAPLFLDWTPLYGFVPFRRLYFLGRKSSDYLDIIAKKGWESEVVEHLSHHLSTIRSAWDVLLCEDIPDASQMHRLLLDTASHYGLLGTAEISERCPKVILPQSWDTYLQMQTKKTRHELRRRERGLYSQFDAVFETVRDEHNFDAAFEEFVALHQERWNTRGEPGVFADPTCRAFQSEAARRLFRKGLVRLNFLKLNGKRAVGSYAFARGGHYALYLLGMGNTDGARKYSPGITLCSENIRQAISEGCRVFDFMRGSEDYKYTFLARDEPTWTITLHSTGRFSLRLSRLLLTLAVLTEALRLRMRKEVWRLKYVANRHGVFSWTMARHCLKSLVETVHDALQKFRRPLQPRYVHHPAVSFSNAARMKNNDNRKQQLMAR